MAADRPQNLLQRPELTWRADQQAKPWITSLAGKLGPVGTTVGKISDRGREALGRLQTLELEQLRAALSAGDEANTELASQIQQLRAVRDASRGSIEDWRLGPATVELLRGIDAADSSARQVSSYWQALEANAQQVAGLIESMLAHDALVFRATAAGRQSKWVDALDLMNQAHESLANATSIRAELAKVGAVGTLDELLARSRAYDDALVALYTYVRDTGRQDGQAFTDLKHTLDQAQAALPTDTSAMSVIVGEAAGPPIAQALVMIEGARGDIRDALSAVSAATGSGPPKQ